MAPVTLVPDAAALTRLAEGFRAQGFAAAVVNSAASAGACAPLAAAGLACTLMVHEMPRLLQERGLAGPLRGAMAAVARVVFASPFVRDGVATLVDLPAGRTSVLPQGLYSPVRTVAPAVREAMRAELRVPPGALLAMGLGYADLRKGFDLSCRRGGWRRPRGWPCTCCGRGDIDPSGARVSGRRDGRWRRRRARSIICRAGRMTERTGWLRRTCIF